MRTPTILLTLSVFGDLVLSGCSATSENNTLNYDGSSEMQKITGAPVSVAGARLLMPRQLAIAAGFLFVSDEGAAPVLHVVNLEHPAQYYALGVLGEAPNDFHSFPLLSRQAGNPVTNLHATDMLTNTVFSMHLSKDSVWQAPEYKIPAEFRINDNLITLDDSLVAGTTAGASSSIAFIFDRKNNSTTFIPYPTFLPETVDKRYHEVVFKTHNAYNEKKRTLAFAFEYFENIYLYNIDNGTTLLLQPADPLRENNFEGELQSAPLNEKTILHYTDIFATEDYLYALYLGVADGEANSNPEKLRMSIRVFDWSGNFIQTYQLDKPIISFAVYESGTSFYGSIHWMKKIRCTTFLTTIQDSNRGDA